MNIGATSTSLLSMMPSPGELNLPISPPDGSVTNASVLVGDGVALSVPAAAGSGKRETSAVSTELAVGGAQAEITESAKKRQQARI